MDQQPARHGGVDIYLHGGSLNGQVNALLVDAIASRSALASAVPWPLAPLSAVPGSSRSAARCALAHLLMALCEPHGMACNSPTIEVNSSTASVRDSGGGETPHQGSVSAVICR